MATKTKNALGRVTALGPKEPWQVAFLLPRKWDDLSRVITDFTPEQLGRHHDEETLVVLRGRLAGRPEVVYRPVPRTSGRIVDRSGRMVGFTIFGNTKEQTQALQAHENDLYLIGKVDVFKGYYQLKNVEVLADSRWAGRLRPRYPGKSGVIGPDTVRSRVIAILSQTDAFQKATEFLLDQASGGQPDALHWWLKDQTDIDLNTLLQQAHAPSSEDMGRWAQRWLSRLDAMTVLRQAGAGESDSPATRHRLERSWRPRSQALPFDLTDGQQGALNTMASDMNADHPMRRLLSGDVGSGKTAVYAVMAATLVDDGGRVAVLAPNVTLAHQIADCVQDWWPDITVTRVTGDSDDSNLTEPAFLVGTTALLHRAIGELDFVVVDEQHKFSRKQREKLRGTGCHLLEVTATCTPRSQALVELGLDAVSRLDGIRVDKRIETRIWGRDDRRKLMQAVKDTVAQGQQVLVICPNRGDDNDTDIDAVTRRKHAAKALALWEKHFPGRVRLSHGGLTDDEKNEAINALRDDQADVLVSTTVVEVGIDLPKLYRVVVVDANRLGLVTLHQIRGRVARRGGTGYCDLVVYSDEAERLRVLCETNDGFEVAQKDLRLRGFGDLSTDSDVQKGFESNVLFGRPLTVDAVEAAMDTLDQLEMK